MKRNFVLMKKKFFYVAFVMFSLLISFQSFMSTSNAQVVTPTSVEIQNALNSVSDGLTAKEHVMLEDVVSRMAITATTVEALHAGGRMSDGNTGSVAPTPSATPMSSIGDASGSSGTSTGSTGTNQRTFGNVNTDELGRMILLVMAAMAFMLAAIVYMFSEDAKHNGNSNSSSDLNASGRFTTYDNDTRDARNTSTNQIASSDSASSNNQPTSSTSPTSSSTTQPVTNQLGSLNPPVTPSAQGTQTTQMASSNGTPMKVNQLNSGYMDTLFYNLLHMGYNMNGGYSWYGSNAGHNGTSQDRLVDRVDLSNAIEYSGSLFVPENASSSDIETARKMMGGQTGLIDSVTLYYDNMLWTLVPPEVAAANWPSYANSHSSGGNDSDSIDALANLFTQSMGYGKVV